ncbi:hypothetical protein vBBceHLY2_00087 [Bacillus phage vB_BceH_LY2]|nr:hypothetical protein vBBceHLY2_00087 [Bacillus phage vB_BceH_LY2]
MTKPYGLRKRQQDKRDKKIARLEYENYMLTEENKILDEFQWDAIKVLTYYYHHNYHEARKQVSELIKNHEAYIITIPPKEDKPCYNL